MSQTVKTPNGSEYNIYGADGLDPNDAKPSLLEQHAMDTLDDVDVVEKVYYGAKAQMVFMEVPAEDSPHEALQVAESLDVSLGDVVTLSSKMVFMYSA